MSGGNETSLPRVHQEMDRLMVEVGSNSAERKEIFRSHMKQTTKEEWSRLLLVWCNGGMVEMVKDFLTFYPRSSQTFLYPSKQTGFEYDTEDGETILASLNLLPIHQACIGGNLELFNFLIQFGGMDQIFCRVIDTSERMGDKF